MKNDKNPRRGPCPARTCGTPGTRWGRWHQPPRAGWLLLAVVCTCLAEAPARALTLAEAVRLGSLHNHRVQEFRNLSEASEHRVSRQKGAWMPRVDVGYGYSHVEGEIIFGTRDTSTFTAGVTYNLFSGLSDLRSLEESRSMRDASRYEQQGVEADVALEVKRAYLGYLRAKLDRDVAAEAVELLERQVRDADLFFQEGLLAKNDVLRNEVDRASAVQELYRQEWAVTIARKTLERVMGQAIEASETIASVEPLPAVDLDEGSLAREMLAGRSELRYLDALAEAKRKERDAVFGGYLPVLDLALTYNRYGDSLVPDGREGPFVTDEELRAEFLATWNLFDGFDRRFTRKATLAEWRSLRERRRDTEAELRLQLSRALEGYRVAERSVGVAKKAVEQAEENYRITQNRFRQRVATTTEQLDARFLLTRARSEHIGALYVLYESGAFLERVIERDFLLIVPPEEAGPAPGVDKGGR